MTFLTIKNKGKLYYIYEDSEYIGFLYKSDFEKAGIDFSAVQNEGMTKVYDDSLQKIKDLVIYKAYDKAVSYLSDSEKCSDSIKLKLRMKSYPDYAIDEAVNLLYEYNYLNDERFAESYIRTYMYQKSRSLLRRELDMRHIRIDDLESLMDRVYSEEDMNEDKAIERLLKRFDGQDMTDERSRRRAAGLLVRHGFSFEQINNHLT